jgi:hypothetical protein
MTSATSPADPSGVPAAGVSLVLVSGSGRSGTSSLAGSLKRLGLHVPQPEVEASETNPRGFYEPQWVIDFHKGYLKQLAMHNIDSRPDAPALVAELAATGEPQQRLKEWLSGQLDEPRLVVKDPHAFWFADVWTEVCADLGIDLKWLTALRHPAEVVGSRDIAYLQSQSEELRLVKETSNVAGWVNAALLTERAGRGTSRSFIRYGDLLADWRAALARAGDQLAITYDADLSDHAPHAVDEFIEPSMRKSQLTWDDLHLPAHLRETAQEVWDLLGRLVEDPADRGATTRLDEIHTEYVARYAEAVALTYDHSKAEAVLAARKARDVQRATMQDLRRQLREAEQRATRPSRGSLLDRLPGRARRG